MPCEELEIVAGELGFKEVMRSLAAAVPKDFDRSILIPEAKEPSRNIVVPGAKPVEEP